MTLEGLSALESIFHAASDISSDEDVERSEGSDDGAPRQDESDDDFPLSSLLDPSSARPRRNRRLERQTRGRRQAMAVARQRDGQVEESPVLATQRKTLDNPITGEDCRAAIVSEEVLGRYTTEIIHFTDWVLKNKPEWFTDHGLQKASEVSAIFEGETKRKFWKRRKVAWLELLKAANTEPILKIDQITPQDVVEFLGQQANQQSGSVLSTSAYSTKKSAIIHLFRCHNDFGFTAQFDATIKTLWKGFTRSVTARRATKSKSKKKKARQKKKGGNKKDGNTTDGNNVETPNLLPNDSFEFESDSEDEDDRDEFKGGKVPMSPALYRKVAFWLASWGNNAGIEAALFVVLTWNLVCRGNNTAKVCFSHMVGDAFDNIGIHFRHTKTQQFGTAKKYRRAIYSNPYEWFIDFPFLLGLYCATAFGQDQGSGAPLFPGTPNATATRMGRALRKVLLEHEQEVLEMGYDSISDLGLHSIRKGASSYLASLPAGPPPAGVCIRGGWSMGHVKDIYWHHMQAGDEFVGRCVSMLNMLGGKFGVSPPHFNGGTDLSEIIRLRNLVFPHFKSCSGMECILTKALASLIFHREQVMSFEVGHSARNISLFKEDMSTLPQVIIKFAWEMEPTSEHSNYHITGVPPHIKQLVDLEKLKNDFEKSRTEIVDNVLQGMFKYFDDRRIGGGELTEARIREMISGSMNTANMSTFASLEKQIETLGQKLDGMVDNATRPGTGSAHCANSTVANPPAGTDANATHAGIIAQGPRRLPEDFDFPSGTPQPVWILWNTGDFNAKIPPLRTCQAGDFAFLKNKPKPKCHIRNARGKFRDRRREPRKTWNDMKYLCEFIEKYAVEHGCDKEDRSFENVLHMFAVFAPLLKKLSKNKRVQNQISWATTVARLRDFVKLGQKEQESEEVESEEEIEREEEEEDNQLNGDEDNQLNEDIEMETGIARSRKEMRACLPRASLPVNNNTRSRSTKSGASQGRSTQQGAKAKAGAKATPRDSGGNGSAPRGGTTTRSGSKRSGPTRGNRPTKVRRKGGPRRHQEEMDSSTGFFETLPPPTAETQAFLDRVAHESLVEAGEEYLRNTGMFVAPVPPRALEVNYGTSSSVAERGAYMARLDRVIPPNENMVRRHSRLPPSYFENLAKARRPATRSTTAYVRTREKRDKPTRAGACAIEGCQWAQCIPGAKCSNAQCYSYLHTVCAIEKGLAVDGGSQDKYCCRQCMEAGL